MVFRAFLALSFVLSVLGENTYPANKKYCAHIASGVASGAQGFFAMEIDSSTGTAVYKFEVDTRDFTSPTACDFSQGLDWHLHSKWDELDYSSTTCGGAQNHYDPNYACGPNSQGSSAECTDMGRNGDDYDCTQANYQDGMFGKCEVGDLSGKFGDIKPNDDGIMSSGFLHDPLPPYIVDYAAPNSAVHHWESVVFHCKSDNGARILCAKFLEDTGTDSECTENGGYETASGGGGGGSGSGGDSCECEEKGYTYTRDNIVMAVVLTLVISVVLNIVSWVLCKFNPSCNTSSPRPIVVQQMPGRASGDSSNPIHKL